MATYRRWYSSALAEGRRWQGWEAEVGGGGGGGAGGGRGAAGEVRSFDSQRVAVRWRGRLSLPVPQWTLA